MQQRGQRRCHRDVGLWLASSSNVASCIGAGAFDKEPAAGSPAAASPALIPRLRLVVHPSGRREQAGRTRSGRHAAQTRPRVPAATQRRCALGHAGSHHGAVAVADWHHVLQVSIFQHRQHVLDVRVQAHLGAGQMG